MVLVASRPQTLRWVHGLGQASGQAPSLRLELPDFAPSRLSIPSSETIARVELPGGPVVLVSENHSSPSVVVSGSPKAS